MKLIRTLIETKLSDNDTPPRPSEIAEKPRSRSDAPVSKALSQRRPLSEQLDPRLKEFKSDLAELTPRRTPILPDQKRKKVWDLDAEELATPQEDVKTLPIEEPDLDTFADPASADDASVNASETIEVPNPLQPRKAPSGGRVKTRIMGFSTGATPDDVFDRKDNQAPDGGEFAVGWLVVTNGPGRGKSFVLQNLVSTIGRGEDQTITLNFGDDTISRNNHAAVAYDDQMNACFLGYGGKANLVRLNGRPVLTTEQLNNGDVIRVGETDLRFVALCGPDFSWDQDKAEGDG